MSQTALQFPDGHTALIHDPDQVPVKKRRPYSRAQMAMGVLTEDIPDDLEDDDKRRDKLLTIAGAKNPELIENLNDALILAFVSQWGYGAVTQEVLEEIPSGSYNKLLKHCEPLAKHLSANFEVTPDPKATTGDSSAGAA
jgi:hypothetical protein